MCRPGDKAENACAKVLKHPGNTRHSAAIAARARQKIRAEKALICQNVREKLERAKGIVRYHTS